MPTPEYILFWVINHKKLNNFKNYIYQNLDMLHNLGYTIKVQNICFLSSVGRATDS